jgi:hypothetical protein
MDGGVAGMNVFFLQRVVFYGLSNWGISSSSLILSILNPTSDIVLSSPVRACLPFDSSILSFLGHFHVLFT